MVHNHICGIKNIVKKQYFTEEYYRVIINNLWFETLNEENLDVNLYLDTVNYFIGTLDLNIVATNEDDELNDVYTGMADNLYNFSAAKQYQFVRECNEVKRESFNSFYEECEKIFLKYYERYMAMEDDMVEQQIKSAMNWINLTK